jgi:hypothetical protein
MGPPLLTPYLSEQSYRAYACIRGAATLGGRDERVRESGDSAEIRRSLLDEPLVAWRRIVGGFASGRSRRIVEANEP